MNIYCNLLMCMISKLLQLLSYGQFCVRCNAMNCNHGDILSSVSQIAL